MRNKEIFKAFDQHYFCSATKFAALQKYSARDGHICPLGGTQRFTQRQTIEPEGDRGLLLSSAQPQGSLSVNRTGSQTGLPDQPLLPLQQLIETRDHYSGGQSLWLTANWELFSCKPFDVPNSQDSHFMPPASPLKFPTHRQPKDSTCLPLWVAVSSRCLRVRNFKGVTGRQTLEPPAMIQDQKLVLPESSCHHCSPVMLLPTSNWNRAP